MLRLPILGAPPKKWCDERGGWHAPDAYIAHVPNPACQECGGQCCKLGLTIYLNRKSLSAPWQRRRIFVLLHAVAQRQLRFLTGAAVYPKPLRVKEGAELAGLSPSDVSQLAGQLRVRTPVGVFRLRALFASPSGCSNPRISAPEVRGRVGLLAKANPRATDREIAEELRQAGIFINRRVVAKYRRDMGLGRERGFAVEVVELVLRLIEGEDKQNPLTDNALSHRLKESGFDQSSSQVGAIRRSIGVPTFYHRRKKLSSQPASWSRLSWFSRLSGRCHRILARFS